MDKASKSFQFYSRHNLIYLTGRKARNLSELLSGIREASYASIYYHTHHFLQQFEFLSPEPPNDFAYWISTILHEHVLGEKIASIDLRNYFRIQDIKEKILAVSQENGEIVANGSLVPSGLEFHFMEAQTFLIPTKYLAWNLTEFLECLRHVDTLSIYYHMFESRLRLSIDKSDMSLWLEDELHEKKLGEAILRLDPYTRTMANLRAMLIQMVEKRLEGLVHGEPG